MEQIRTDLGQEAIILNTKKVKTKGFLGLFRKQQIEVIAALDTQNKGNELIKPTVQRVNQLVNVNSQKVQRAYGMKCFLRKMLP